MIRVELAKKVMTPQHAALFRFTSAEHGFVGARQSSRYACIYERARGGDAGQYATPYRSGFALMCHRMSPWGFRVNESARTHCRKRRRADWSVVPSIAAVMTRSRALAAKSQEATYALRQSNPSSMSAWCPCPPLRTRPRTPSGQTQDRRNAARIDLQGLR
jgi:hypothetical protein